MPGVIAAILLGAAAQAAVVAPAEAPDRVKVAWLLGHSIGAGPVAGDYLILAPPSFFRAKLYLLGESHGSAAPQRIDIAWVEELMRRVGLRDYLAEMDAVQAETLNRYLETGDEAFLLRVFSAWRGSAQWGNTAFTDKVRSLRALNLKQPSDRRVRFMGVDAVQDWPLMLDWLQAQGAAVDRAAFADARTEAARSALAATWAKAATRAPTPLLDRLAAMLTLRGEGAGRERAIFESYAFAVRSGELGLRPAYGLWGFFHVLQAGVNGQKPFAMQVATSDLPTAKAVVSMPLFALDSAVMIPGGAGTRLTNLNADGPVVRAPGAASLKAASTAGYSAQWRITGKGSPYAAAPDLFAISSSIGQSFKPDDPTLPATAYAQVVGTYRGSDWAPPLR